MTDLELARAFFDRLKGHKFELKYVDFDGHEIGSEEYDEERSQSIELYGARGEFCNFDFHTDGSFYRISGFISGFWADEVDWKKY